MMALGLFAGCTWNTKTVRRVAQITSIGSSRARVKRKQENHLEHSKNTWSAWVGYGEEQPGERTKLFMRTYALEAGYTKNPKKFLVDLHASTNSQPDLESLHALAELCLLQGQHGKLKGDERYAGQMYATAVNASYQYLFDSEFDAQRNIYDPVFREVCDIYNRSLEGILRIICERKALRPQGVLQATSLDGRPLNITIKAEGRWAGSEFERFEFVSDYSTEGLRNVHVTHGLGVPLIALRKHEEINAASKQFYPEGISVPLTAFVKTSVRPDLRQPTEEFEIQLLDPLERTHVAVNDRVAPLESDITTPLAYYLDNPLLDTRWFATAALLKGDFAQKFGGLYMLEPYDPSKIPVVMVHGFWSSPMTWTEMFNDLRADKSIRDNYQFWFYLYPSGQPFWYSARQMREDLADATQSLDPQNESRSLSEMVLVGHSMGGLISRLQTIDSEDHIWNALSDAKFSEMESSDETRKRIQETVFFDANPNVARVVTIGTPHRGSSVSNSFTRWVSEKLFSLPSYLTNELESMTKKDQGIFNSNVLDITTSTESLAPDSPMFRALAVTQPNPRVRYHNVIGVHESSGVSALFSNNSEPTDGVVTVASAHFPLSVSEITIEEEHSLIHQHPRAILEVRRVLMEHLLELYGVDYQTHQDLPPIVRPVKYDEVKSGGKVD